jgi:hypothetical protein
VTDPHLDVRVSSAAAGKAGVPLAGQPDPLAVVDPRRNLDFEHPLLDHASRAAALLTRMLDQLAGAVAGRAGPRADELAEHASRDLPNATRAAATRTRSDLRVRLRPVPAAAIAWNCDAERHLALGAGDDLGEVDLDLRRDVRAARPRASTSKPEQIVAEERREEIRQAAEVERGRPEAAAPEPRMPEAVVEVPSLRVGKNLVGLHHFAKAVLGIGLFRHVGVELPREPPESALDLVGARGSRHTKKLVVVAFGRRHYGTACGAVLRTRGLRPRVRLN